MINDLYSVNETNQLIEKGKVLILAGAEDLLKKLKKGNWIGGTIPYFMANNGGCVSKDKIFVNDITDNVKQCSIKLYDKSNIDKIAQNSFPNGFNYLLLPGFSQIHSEYALKSHNIPELFNNPLLGWITGVYLNDLGKITPKVFVGDTLECSDNKGVALHAELPDNKIATVEILNIFIPDENGDLIVFDNSGFECKECFINGKKIFFTDYLVDANIDTKLPIVADYAGAKINVSIQSVDHENKIVKFYAPIQANVEYRFAAKVDDYVKTFIENIPKSQTNVISSFNCILNYLYPKLEGKKTGDFKGPFTFGEIAYILVNQTLVYLVIEDK